MPVFAWILLLATSPSVNLVNQTYRIPANDWSFQDLGLEDRAAQVNVSFDVESGPPVQLLVMEKGDLERLNRGESHGVLMAAPVGPAGHLHVRPERPGDYVVVVENHSGRSEPSQVHLRVSVTYMPDTLLAHDRQIAVIVISFAMFFSIVTYSARRLWRAVRR